MKNSSKHFMESFLKKHQNRAAVVAVVLSGLVFYVSLLPKQEIPSVNILQIDKLVHFTMYFTLTVLYFIGFFFQSNKVSIAKAVFLSILIGFIVELLQHFATSTRSFDVFDIVANSIGAIVAGLLIFSLYTKKFVK